jgi:hypothetical protein
LLLRRLDGSQLLKLQSAGGGNKQTEWSATDAQNGGLWASQHAPNVAALRFTGPIALKMQASPCPLSAMLEQSNCCH